MNGVTINTVPRDAEELAKLKRGQLVRLASQLNLLLDDQYQQAFMTMQPPQMAVEVLQGLQRYDAANGGAPPAATPAPQAVPPQAGPPAGPPPAAGVPPQAPPPQVQAPQMPQGGPPQGLPHGGPPTPPPQGGPPMAPPQGPPQAAPPMAPPAGPPAGPPIPQGAPPAAPPQAAPPQAPPQSPPMAPPQAAPPMAPPQAGPPMAPPQAAPQAMPPRQPQTTSDPTGDGNQLSAVLQSLTADLKTIGEGVDAGNADVRAVVNIQRAILKTLLGMAEAQGLEPKDLSTMARMHTDESVRQYVASLDGGSGKS